MVDISREEDRKALFGTVTFVTLLLMILILMGLMNGCSEVQAEEQDGGVDARLHGCHRAVGRVATDPNTHVRRRHRWIRLRNFTRK